MDGQTSGSLPSKAQELFDRLNTSYSDAQDLIDQFNKAKMPNRARALQADVTRLKARVSELRSELRISTSTLANTYCSEPRLREILAKYPFASSEEDQQRGIDSVEYNSSKRRALGKMAANYVGSTAGNMEAHGLAESAPLNPTKSLNRIRLDHLIGEQKSYATESLWRIGASVNAFQVQDPDPNAVDRGAILGLQFEIMRNGRYTASYKVFLNREFGTEGFNRPFDVPFTTADEGSYLRVHRHTFPVGIPVHGVAEKWLPPPKTADPTQNRPEQSLAMFVQDLRNRLVAYNNRLARVADVRRLVGLRERKKKEPAEKDQHVGQPEGADAESFDGELSSHGVRKQLVNVGITDAEAKSINLEFANYETARMLIDDFGGVEKVIGDLATPDQINTYRQFVKQFKHPQDLVDAMDEQWQDIQKSMAVSKRRQQGPHR